MVVIMSKQIEVEGDISFHDNVPPFHNPQPSCAETKGALGIKWTSYAS
jgi:hypothetical protein